MAVRSALVSDLDELARLNDQIQHQHAILYPDEFKYPIDSVDVKIYFKSIIGSDENTVLVAESNDAVQAYLYYETQQRPENTFKFGFRRFYIHHVVVDAPYRRSGIATELFQAVEKRARLQGIRVIGLDSWALNTDAHVYFEQRGLDVCRLVYSKTLD